MTPTTNARRIVSIVAHAALGAAIGYTLSKTLPADLSIPVSLGMFTGAAVWLIVEMRRLRRHTIDLRAEIEHLRQQAQPIAFFDPHADERPPVRH